MAALTAPTGLSRWYSGLHDATIEGRRVRYLDVGDPDKSPVVLVHGIGCDWTHWSSNLDALVADHRVIAVDIPGFGASEPLPPGSELALTVQAIIGLIDTLELPQVALVGHSLGGLISWLVTAAEPERVSRLVLVDSATVALAPAQIKAILHSFTFANRWLTDPKVARAVLRRPRLRKLLIAALFADTSTITPEMAIALLGSFTGAPGFIDALHGARDAIVNADPALMETPTLVVWGTRDTIFGVGQARKMASAMPNAELVEIAGARHWPHVEQPARFNDVLTRFLQSGDASRTQGAASAGTR